MATLEQRVTDLEEAYRSLTEKQETLAIDMPKLVESVGLNFRLMTRGIDTRLTQFERKIDAKIDPLTRDVATLKSDVATLKEDMSGLKDDMAAVLKILSDQFKPNS